MAFASLWFQRPYKMIINDLIAMEGEKKKTIYWPGNGGLLIVVFNRIPVGPVPRNVSVSICNNKKRQF